MINLISFIKIWLIISVDYLIQNTSLSVVVYTGQLDIIVATPGKSNVLNSSH